jgi:hypothetical protein
MCGILARFHAAVIYLLMSYFLCLTVPLKSPILVYCWKSPKLQRQHEWLNRSESHQAQTKPNHLDSVQYTHTSVAPPCAFTSCASHMNSRARSCACTWTNLAVGEEPAVLDWQRFEDGDHAVAVFDPKGLDRRGAIRNVVRARACTNYGSSLPRVVPATPPPPPNPNGTEPVHPPTSQFRCDKHVARKSMLKPNPQFRCKHRCKQTQCKCDGAKMGIWATSGTRTCCSE